MKKIIAVISFFGFFLSIGFAQQADPAINWARISETLEAQMKGTPEDEYIQVSIILYDQVDLRSMMDYFRIEKVPLQRRAEQVITSLQNKAASTQPGLIAYMDGLEGVEPGSVNSLWIANELRAKLNKKGIAALSLRSEVDYLYFEPLREFQDYKSAEAVNEMLLTPNGHEPAHELMNATGMWAKGYTGTGRKVFVIDEGADLNHPALNRNYRGFTDGNRVSFFDSRGGASDTIPEKCADFNDHGTLVLGTTVGFNFSNRDTIGAAPDGLWMSSPLLTADGNCVNASTDESFALQWALDPDGNPSTIEDMPDVVNMSFGFSNPNQCSNPTLNRITALEAAGTAVIIAAGNAGPDPTTTGSPANAAISLVNTFAVGSVNPSSSIASFSSRGPSLCTDSIGSLKIKPEIVVPGSNIRTTSNGNAYATVQGTSFSAPFACGALLLLKEAFPTLSGEDIKLAMYFSAKDLGVVGEDNDYGMGLLDVVAAYDYLVGEGNTPAPRNPDADGLVHNMNDLSGFSCAKDVEPSFLLENSGTSTMTAATINYAYSNGINGTVNWTGSLLKNRSERVSLPVESLPPGNYTLTVELLQVNGKTDYSIRDNKLSSNFSIFEEVTPNIVTTSPVACAGGSAVIETTLSDSGREVVWFDQATGGEIVGIGNPFVTPELTANTTYYAEAMRVESAGLPNIEAGQSYASLSEDSYLEFDVLNELEIRSVKVYAATPGVRRVAINDEDGFLLGRSSFVSLAPGEHTIELNVTVPVGNKYRMVQIGQVDDLFVTVNNFSFPLVIDNFIRITGSNDGLYNFFYDWEIVSSFNCDRVAQAVNVSTTSANAAFAPSRTNINLASNGWVNFNNTSSGASSYSWDFGDGNTSEDQSPTHEYRLAGTYTVTLIAEAAGGCTDVATAVIVASGVVGIEEDLAELGKISVYPNPSEGKFVLDMEFFNREEVAIEIFDLPGRRIWSNSAKSYLKEKVEMDLGSANKGIYLLKVTVGGLTWTQKIIKE